MKSRKKSCDIPSLKTAGGTVPLSLYKSSKVRGISKNIYTLLCDRSDINIANVFRKNPLLSFTIIHLSDNIIAAAFDKIQRKCQKKKRSRNCCNGKCRRLGTEALRRAKKILEQTGIDPDTRVKDLTEAQEAALRGSAHRSLAAAYPRKGRRNGAGI